MLEVLQRKCMSQHQGRGRAGAATSKQLQHVADIWIAGVHPKVAKPVEPHTDFFSKDGLKKDWKHTPKGFLTSKRDEPYGISDVSDIRFWAARQLVVRSLTPPCKAMLLSIQDDTRNPMPRIGNTHTRKRTCVLAASCAFRSCQWCTAIMSFPSGR